jgi:hypothetical protein
MKGDREGIQLPLDVFLTCFKRDLLKGACSSLLKLTTPTQDQIKTDEADCSDSDDSEDYVEGYENLIELCVKPLMLTTLEKDLSFVLSASNLTLFSHNYCTAK